MKKGLNQALLGAAAAIALGSFAGSAHADPIVFTWNPNVFGVSGQGMISNAAALTVADDSFATITNATGAFSESGFLNITGFQDAGGNPITTSGLSTNYKLYFGFNATGTIPGFSPAALGTTQLGTITSLNYSLIIDPLGNTVFNQGASNTVPWTVSLNGDDKTIASGSLLPGTGGVSIGGATHATAAADVTVNPNLPDANAFFVDPSALQYIDLLLETNFTNTGGEARVTVAGADTDVKFVNGGGTADLINVPEPATLSIFGAALLGLGFAARRRRKS